MCTMASQSSNGNTVTVNVGALSTAIAVAIQQATQATQPALCTTPQTHGVEAATRMAC